MNCNSLTHSFQATNARVCLCGQTRRSKRKPIQSAGEAMDLFKRTSPQFLADARDVAVDLCLQNGATHTHAVREEMERRGLLPTGPEYHFGSVFNSRRFEKTGSLFQPTRPAKPDSHFHGWRPVNIWQLRPTA
jgi:hypothetical protein